LFNFLDEKTAKSKNINSSLQHITYKTIDTNKEFFKIDMSNIEIITIVRNPYNRIISDLFWHKKITINSTTEEVYHKIQKYLRDETLDNHNIPQYLFVTDEKMQLIPNIKILYSETLSSDMHKLGYVDFDVKINDNKNKPNYFHYLNPSSIQLINEFYDYDFKLFNYDKIITRPIEYIHRSKQDFFLGFSRLSMNKSKSRLQNCKKVCKILNDSNK
jgi:uncharacterized protein YlzI (FlbEa/FlbD family)